MYSKKGKKKRHAAQSMLSFTSTFGRALYHFCDEGYSSYNMKDLVVKKCFNLRYKYFLTFTRDQTKERRGKYRRLYCQAKCFLAFTSANSRATENNK